MEKVNISFAGCGFLGIYHVGVASCFKEYAPHLLLNKISGASVGALAACCLLTDITLGVFTSEMLQIIYEIRQRTLGPFNPLVNVQNMLRNIIVDRLPENAYKMVSGRLFISLTRVTDGSNVIVSEFKSNEELLNSLMASAFVPFFSGFIPPKVNNVRYVDGGFSNNLPILDENTITVSPFCGESDICPRDSSVQLFHINLCNTSVEVSKPNIYRFARILFPPSAEVLSKMCKQGFDDALRFLQRNNMISCTKCLTVQRTISLPVVKHRSTDDQHETYDPECEECIHHIQKAARSKLPEPVLANLEDAIEKTNKELTTWVFKHKGVNKVVSVVALPYVLTVDAIKAVLKKFAEIAPEVFENATELSKSLLDMIIRTVNKMNRTGLFLASKVFGPLSISINIDDRKTSSRFMKDPSVKSKVNVEFNFDPNAKTDRIDSHMFEDGETLIVHPLEPVELQDDTYDHLLEVIDHHEAIMAFYYMDDSNKMNVVEFIDVTNDDKIIGKIDESDVKIISSIVDKSNDPNSEYHHNEEWPVKHRNVAASYTHLETCDDGAMSICSGSDGGNESLNIPSDPESDWNQPPKEVKFAEDLEPESEREFKKPTKSSGTHYLEVN